MKRVAYFAYGTGAYLFFVGCLLYAIGFVGGFGVPKTIDSGVPGPLAAALAINVALLSLFAVQHSGMARRGFKRMITKLVPKEMERSTYVLATCSVLAALFVYWEPMPTVIWEVESVAGAVALQALSLLGWAIVALATINIDHFDLFGMRQTWFATIGKQYRDLGFRTPGLYKWMRHPIQTGFLIAFWATPTMTYGHLLFAGMCTGYIFFAVKVLEERDLLREHPERYQAYMDQVGAFVPKTLAAAPVEEPAHN